MRTEDKLRWIAVGCAALLLFGLVSDRTSWVGGGGVTTDSAGYNWATLFAGIVALVALASSFWAWPRLPYALLGAAVAFGAFGAAAYVCGSYWLALARGDARLDGIATMPEHWRVYPATGPIFFTTAALVGALAALLLAASWLRQARSK